MIEEYKRKLTETVGTTIEQEGYGTAMKATEDLTDGDPLTEAVTKYAEHAAQAKARMAQMEAKFEEKFAMMKIQQLPQKPYYHPPTPRIS